LPTLKATQDAGGEAPASVDGLDLAHLGIEPAPRCRNSRERRRAD
jgi:hypothetical protein